MNDQPAAPFSPFSPSPPPTPAFEPAGAGQGKKPRKKRSAKARTAKPAKAVRQPKAVVDRPRDAEPVQVPTRRRARKPQALKIDPMIVFEAAVGLSLADVAGISVIIGEMHRFPKKSRTKIVAALGKVFA